MFDTFMPKLLNVNLFHYVYILLLLCGYEGTRPNPYKKLWYSRFQKKWRFEI